MKFVFKKIWYSVDYSLKSGISKDYIDENSTPK